jgi:hypothetical protein
MFRLQKILKSTRTKLYYTLDLPALLYSSETWNIRGRDAKRITTAEMKYMKKKQQHTLAQIIKQTQRLQKN